MDVGLIQELLRYDPETGQIFWRVNRQCVKAGSLAGSKDSHGYIQIRINGRKVMAHQVAWALLYGEWPENDIDHWDHDPSNNRKANLRKATRTQNCYNRIPRSKSGVKGVYRRGNGWQAVIWDGSRNIHLGFFQSLELASECRELAEKLMHGDFAYQRSK